MIRGFYIAAGVLCLGLAVLGAILPLMPSTVFVILAAFCFGKSSPRLETWLMENKVFGPSLRLWREKGAIPRVGKLAALGAFAISAASTLIFAPLPWSLAAPIAAVFGGAWIWTRPEG